MLRATATIVGVFVIAANASEPVPVTVDEYVRAETDHMIRATLATGGMDVGEIFHLRQPTTPDTQPVIRMNQDTLYSATVVDLSKP